MFRLALIAALVGSALGAQRADVVVVRGTTTARERPKEASGIPRWARTVVGAARAAGLEVQEITDEAVEKGALRGRRLAIFTFNGRMDPEEMAEVREFVADGGKVIYFASLPKEVERDLGFNRKSQRRTNYEGECEFVKFDTAALKGAPPKMRQATWNFNVADPGPGGRVLGTWMDREGKDTTIPAVAANAKAMWMGHVLTGADATANAQFLLAAVGHFLPDVWEASVQRVLATRGAWGEFDGLDALRAAARARLTGAPRDAALAALARADQQRQQATRLLGQKLYPKALAASKAALAEADTAYCLLAPSRQGEFRGIWMHPSIVKGKWDEAMKACADAGLNAVVPVVSGGYYAYYHSKVLPRAKGWEDKPDQLAACVAAAHKHGIEVHPWRVNWQAQRMRPAEFETLKKAGRLQVNYKGEVQKWLCPSHEANQKLELDAMVEMAARYPVDGIHFDYIRYPNNTTCYCDGCRAKFEKSLGHPVKDWPASAYKGKLKDQYREFRRTHITRLVAAVHRQARKARPDIVISAAVFRNWARHRDTVGQDWKLWVEKGYIDLVNPMDYTNSTKRLAREVRDQVGWVDFRAPLAPGIGISSSSSRMARASQLVEQIETARELGADGYTLFCFRWWAGDTLFGGHRLGVGAQPTYTGLGGPAVEFDLPEPLHRRGGERVYAEGTAIDPVVKVSLALPGGRKASRVAGDVWLETALGRRVVRLAPFAATKPTTVAPRVLVAPGRYRLAVLGTAEVPESKPIRFARRGPVMVVLTPQQRAALREELHPSPPRFAGKGLRVGVFADGFGSSSIGRVLRTIKGVEVQTMRALSPAMLAPCQIVVVPQLRKGQFAPAELKALRTWVRGGGRLVLTHDAVGYRGHEPLFPDVARGTANVRGVKFAFAPLAGVAGWASPSGGPFATSYYDIVTLAAGKAGKVVARVAGGDKAPAAVLGTVGKGKVFAIGLAIGLGPDNADAPPTLGEEAMLRAALRWMRR